jgi:TRAP-type C4-dicarboxylate transport system permease small subunit
MVASLAAVIAMVFLIAAGVIARYVFNSPFLFVEEYSGYLFVLVVCWGLAFTLKDGGHIKVELVVSRLPARIVTWLELAAYVMATGYTIMFTAQLLRMARRSFELNAYAYGAMHTPLGPAQLIMVIGVGALALEFVVETAGKIRTFVNRKPGVIVTRKDGLISAE